MSHKPNFVVVGSGGGGGTIAWLLAKAGYSVTLLEQGPDITKEFETAPGHSQDPPGFNSSAHREEYFRLRRPDRDHGQLHSAGRRGHDRSLPRTVRQLPRVRRSAVAGFAAECRGRSWCAVGLDGCDRLRRCR